MNDVLNNFGGLQLNSLNTVLKTLENGQDNNNDQPLHEFIKHSEYYDDNAFLSFCKENNSNFNVLSVNIQSLNSKLNELKIMLQNQIDNECPVSLLCLQETWISENSDLSLYEIDGYNFISQPAYCSSHAGLAFFIRSDIKFEILPISIKSLNCEGFFIRIRSDVGDKYITIGNIYRAPRCNNIDYQTFINLLLPILEELEKNNSEILIFGDFNVDFLKINEKRIFAEIFDTFTTHSYLPLITLPTRLSGNRGSLIDNCLCKYTYYFDTIVSGILFSNLSDHFPYFVSIDFNVKKHKTADNIICNNYSTKAIKKFKDYFSKINFNNLMDYSSDSNPEYNCALITDKIKFGIENFLCFNRNKFDRYKHKKSNWITAGIIRSIKVRNKMYKVFKLTDITSSDFIIRKTNLRTYNTILRKTIIEAKKLYYNRLFLTHKTNIKETWKNIKSVINKENKNRKEIDSLNVQGVLTNDKYKIVNHLNEYFTSIGPKLSKKIENNSTSSYKKYLRYRTNKIFNFTPVTETEIAKVINDLTNKKTQDSEGISMYLIKEISVYLIPIITITVNQTLTSGIFPSILKTAKVIPLLKRDDPTKPENYRPVSLLPSISKIFEKVIYNQLFLYFTKNNLLFQNQYGFRKEHSTEYAALHLVEKISNMMDQGDVPLAIFLDLTKAFDTLDHNILLDKLMFYGIKNNALKLFTNYLAYRKQYVFEKDDKSNLLPIKTGVPQGSILGPLLFLIYVNDFHFASNIFTFILYADDTTLLARLRDFDNNNSIKDHLAEISNWLILNKLSLNSQKSKFMLFHKPLKKFTVPVVEINKIILTQTKEINYLGLSINHNLTWKSHISQISLKISRIIGILNKLKKELPIFILKLLYDTLILPHLNYCVCIWGYKCERILKLQKKP